MTQPTLVLVCGLPGAGKTTRARQLAAAIPAIRLCPDEWMAALEIDLRDEAFRERLERQFWTQTRELLSLGTSVVMESGFWSRAERDEKRTWARDHGVRVELHAPVVPLEELLARVERRHREEGGLAISRTALEEWSAWFEPPDAEELALFDAPHAIP